MIRLLFSFDILAFWRPQWIRLRTNKQKNNSQSVASHSGKKRVTFKKGMKW